MKKIISILVLCMICAGTYAQTDTIKTPNAKTIAKPMKNTKHLSDSLSLYRWDNNRPDSTNTNLHTSTDEQNKN